MRLRVVQSWLCLACDLVWHHWFQAEDWKASCLENVRVETVCWALSQAASVLGAYPHVEPDGVVRRGRVVTQSHGRFLGPDPSDLRRIYSSGT